MSVFYKSVRELGGKKAFLEEGERSVSYGKFATDLSRFSDFLIQSNLSSGERVIISVGDPYHTALLFIGLVDNGFVPVVAAADLRPTEFDLIYQVTGACGCIMDEVNVAHCIQDQHQFRLVVPVRQVKRKKNLMKKLLGHSSKDDAGVESFPALLDSFNGSPPDKVWPAEHEAYVIMTSGSTSHPKAVVINHEALFSHLATLTNQFHYSENTRLFNVLPLHHVDGLIQGPVVACINGASWLRPFPFSVLNIEPMLLSLYRYQASHLIAVPTILALILRVGSRDSEHFNYEEFKFVVSAAGYLEADLWREFERVFETRVSNLYGLTETVTGGIFSGPDDDSHKIGSIGKPVDCQVRIVGEDGTEKSINETGELLLQGKNVFRGYIGTEAVNDDVFRDGWFCTGDLAHVDDNGLYYIDGRIKNVVISGGENIYPEEVSEVINRHAGINESCCFGVEHAEWGEILVAAVAPGSSFSQEEILDWMEGMLSHYKIPKEWMVVESLPRGPSGKVLLPEVRKMYSLRSTDLQHEEKGDIRDRVYALAARTFKVQKSSLNDDSSPETTRGWDSLAHVEFLLGLEVEFGTKLSRTDMSSILDIKSTLALIQSKIR
jgi:long-chain acyl-CoA synthetase